MFDPELVEGEFRDKPEKRFLGVANSESECVNAFDTYGLYKVSKSELLGSSNDGDKKKLLF